MRNVFVDTNYLVALISPKDQWRRAAREAQQAIGVVRLTTSEWVLAELLNYFAESHSSFRLAAAEVSTRMIEEPGVEIIGASREYFLTGLEFYRARLDKGYSLTDCISMSLMRERGMTEVLTNDTHFAQEGFTILL